MRIPVGTGIGGGIVAEGEPRYLPDILADGDVAPSARKRSSSHGVRSYFGIPLITEGRSIGLLQIDSTDVDAWTEEDRLVLIAFAPIVGAAVQNARLFEREAEAVMRLQELDRQHRDFVAVVSHELRTPLTTVLGYADTVIRHLDGLSHDQLLEMMTRCRGAAYRLTRLVEDLVDLSIIESGTLHAEPAPTDVSALLAEVVASYVPAERQASVALTCDVGTVELDPARTQQIIGNLLSNAAKYSPDTTPIEVTVSTEPAALVVEVRDHGRGIPERERRRIFERFVQLEDVNTRTAGGFGIGLYVVSRLCAALGAVVDVESTPGAGSTFRVHLPLG
jgi:signal transduction histidine kinase